MMIDNANIMGLHVSTLSLVDDVKLAWRFLTDRVHGRYMACANPHALVVAQEDPLFAEALREGDLILPDGVGIILTGKVLGLGFRERVTGPDFFEAFSAQAEKQGGISYFFLGSSETVLEKMRARMASRFPSIRIAGMLSPPFKAEFDERENREMVEAVNAAKPDVLWVGMTAPKQEVWIHRNRDRLEVPFIGAIGAAFDFFAGTRQRAPKWVCSLGLEWVHRSVTEPTRLGRRNLLSNPRFLYRVTLWKIQEIFSRN